jgi:hypothetical protein
MVATARAWSILPAAWLLAGGLAAAGGPAEADIDRWIEQLGSPQFAQREAASRHLAQAGPAALDRLATAVDDGDLEVASRAIEVFREWLGADDAELAAAAERFLERCAERSSPVTARLAGSALEFHAASAAAAARERLESLGAVIRERPAVERRGLEVDLGAAWSGTGGDLRLLTRLRGLTVLSVRGVPLDAPALDVLGRLQTLERLDLFGTGAGAAEAARLAERLPDVRIDVRKGGKLGVASLALGGPCEIRTVEPGSAADQAGIRSGDVIMAVDAQPVADFEALTARLSGRGPGEVLRVEILRDRADGTAERLTCDVRLDAW